MPCGAKLYMDTYTFECDLVDGHLNDIHSAVDDSADGTEYQMTWVSETKALLTNEVRDGLRSIAATCPEELRDGDNVEVSFALRWIEDLPR